METGKWQRQLEECYKYALAQEQTGNISLGSLLDRSFSALSNNKILLFDPLTTISEAYLAMTAQHLALGLVQDSEEMIQGIVRIEALESALIDAGIRSNRFTLNILMERYVAIEPETVTLRELVEHMLYGDCPYIVIVDRLGRPINIVSAKELNSLVVELCGRVPMMPLSATDPIRTLQDTL